MAKMSKKELGDLIESVTADIATLVKTESEDGRRALRKADPGEEAVGEATPEGSSTEPTPPEASASPEGTPGEEGPPPGADPAGDPAAEGGMTPEALQAEYSKLPPEELKMHLLAAKAAFMAVMGADDGMGGGDEMGAGAPPAGPPAGPPSPEASAPVGPPAMKAELDSGDGNGGQIKAGSMAKSEVASIQTRLAKSEADSAALKRALAEKNATITELETSVGRLAEVVGATIARPMRKAVTDISFIRKPGEEAPETVAADVSRMSKSEVMQKLNEVTRASKNLKKSDRDLINNYCYGEVTLDAVAHLIK